MKKLKNFASRLLDILIAVGGKAWTPEAIVKYFPTNDKGEIIFVSRRNLEWLSGTAVVLQLPTAEAGAVLRYSLKPTAAAEETEAKETNTPVLSELEKQRIGKFGALIGKFSRKLSFRASGARLTVDGVNESTCPLLAEVIHRIITVVRLPNTFTEILQLAEHDHGVNGNWKRFVAEDIDQRFDFALRVNGKLVSELDEKIIFSNDIFHEIRLIIRERSTGRLVLDTNEPNQSRYFGMENWKDVMFIYNTWEYLGEMYQRLDEKVSAEILASRPMVEEQIVEAEVETN